MSIFEESDELKYIMEQRWITKRNEFPQSKNDLITKYKYIEDHLNENYHTFVGLGASIAGDGVLTDHGVKHVQNVIDKAWKITKNKTDEFTGYELYILLLAIHFHDLGNISGRKDHEQKIIDIMNEVKTNLPLDIAEQEFVSKIAMAHGGHIPNDKNDKNTLRTLEYETTCNGGKIRPVLLAAILRFSDELADDYNRIIPNIEIPPENQVFQEYSKSLEAIGFSGKTLVFRFRIPYESTQITFKKNNKAVFLYDEILERLLKCLRELDYCSRYSKGFIDIETLSVEIQIREQENSNKVLIRDFFKLCLTGYPKEEAFQLKDFIFIDNNSTTNSKIPKYSSGEELKNAILELEKGGISDV
jgi:hypothetical protein